MTVLISLNDVCRRTTLSRTSINDLVRVGRFPQPVRLAGTSRIAFSEAEVAEWIEARLNERA